LNASAKLVSVPNVRRRYPAPPLRLILTTVPLVLALVALDFAGWNSAGWNSAGSYFAGSCQARCAWAEEPSTETTARPAEPLQTFHFLTDEEIARWQPAHDVGPLTGTTRGLQIAITGSDPFIIGPPRDYPPDQPLIVKLRVHCDAAGWGQLFYFTQHATEKNSVRFPIPRGVNQDVAVYLPPLGKNYRLRFDPPENAPQFFLERIECARRLQLTAPSWDAPQPPAPLDSSLTLTCDQLALIPTTAGEADDWILQFRSRDIARHHNRLRFGYLSAHSRDSVVWFAGERSATSRWRKVGTALESSWTARDPDGATWQLTRSFTPDGGNAIDVQIKLSVDRPREIVFSPLLMLLSHDQLPGTIKRQAILAGVEYLDAEPSSSTADVEGPGALRRVPYGDKLTFPLMALQRDRHYISVIWRPGADVAPWFDSPDRIFGSSRDVLGLIAPGATRAHRVDGEWLPVQPLGLNPQRPLTARATILAGDGRSVVPAVQQYVERQRWPDLPTAISRDQYVQQAAAGWLETGLHEDGLFRHAIGNGFPLQPAADAVWMTAWLARQTTDRALREQLQVASRRGLERVAAGSEYQAAVGHLLTPVIGLVSDRTPATIEQARQAARGALGRFDADLIARYQPPTKGLDFSRTQPSREANGLAAHAVAQLLQAAIYCGDRELIAAGIERLRKLDRYDDSVPRGAQTWEVPLHTPDILAAAHLVQAYTWGYEWTGEKTFLDRARYWAWTGVPFVYLQQPYPGEVGTYSTISVLGATHWEAPLWIGLPVQWCGLVYADRITRLARHDPEGPWDRLAHGITLSAMHQCYPINHPRRGLLPDSFQLELQLRNAADINPGTLQPLAMRYLTGIPAYDLRVGRRCGLTVQAAGLIRELVERDEQTAEIVIRGWSAEPSVVMIHGLPYAPRLLLDGESPRHPVRFLAESGTLLVTLPAAVERDQRLHLSWGRSPQ
jgi:hypothetical protein